MVHESEQDVADAVEQWLTDNFDRVRRNHRFAESERVVDFLANAGPFALAVEVEGEATSVLNGAGQAAAYGNMATREFRGRGVAFPVLAVPEGHIDDPERLAIENMGVGVWEVEA